MTEALTAGRSRGAHRCDGHAADAAGAHLHPAKLARLHRTRRPRPRPTPPRPHLTHARPEGVVRCATGSALWKWADQRPFLAGLCLIVAGIEIGCWAAMPSLLGARSGVSALMFTALLITDGLAVWFLPEYRKLLGVQAAALGLLALTTTNLGGLFVGTGAAVVGGVLAFRWTPAEPPTTAAQPAAAEAAEQAPIARAQADADTFIPGF
jgi:uncharacterized protein DUF6114